MAISYISGSIEKINGGTIVNLGKDIDNNKNWVSSSSNPENIGSVVVNNDHVNPADSGGVFAYNNSRPINKLSTTSLAGLDKRISGNYPIINNTKVIRSSLISTAIREGLFNIYSGQFETMPEDDVYYTCPDDSIGLCFQIEPPPAEENVPYSASGGELEQNGVWLRFRPAPESVDALYEDWTTIYVPSSSLVTSSGVNSTFKTPNLDQVLPNGSYVVEYDTTINHDDTSKNFIGRIKSNATVTNSNTVSIFKVTLNCDIEIPSLEFDPDGDGIGNYTNPLLPMELQMQQFEIIRDNESKLDGVFTGGINGEYTIGTIGNQTASGGSLEVPVVLSMTDPSTGDAYYENFNINISITANDQTVTGVSVIIASEIPRNSTQTGLAFSLP